MYLFSGKEFITTKEAERVSGYSSDHLSRLVRLGKVAGRKVGRVWYIDRESLAAVQVTAGEFITTREANKISGYSADYLGRLVRSGDIFGRKVGRVWVIDQKSLEAFLKAQSNHKIDRARALALARARADEYRIASTSLQNPVRHIATQIFNASRSLGEVGTKPIPVSGLPAQRRPRASRMLAFTVACAVMTSGAFLAHASFIPELAVRAGALAKGVSVGLREMVSDVPSRFFARIDAVHVDVAHSRARVVGELAQRFAYTASPIPASQSLSLAQLAMSAPLANPTRAVLQSPATRIVSVPSASMRDDVTAGLHAAIALMRNPARAVTVLDDGYHAMGAHAYAAIRATLDTYPMLIERAGAHTLSLGASARDELATVSSVALREGRTLPSTLMHVSVAVGEFVVESSRAAVRADISIAYGLSAAGPLSARVATAFVSELGEATLGIAFATLDFAGDALYVVISDSRTLAASSARFLAYAPVIFEDGARFLTHLSTVFENASLDALGRAALAWHNIRGVAGSSYLLGTRLPDVSMLAAVTASTLTTGERTALFTYTTINNFFDSAGRSLASLFLPTPTIVLPELPPHPPSPKATQGTALTTNIPPRVIYQSPVYNTRTTVQGVSLDFLNQSLASLKSDLTSQMAVLIRPIAGQVATNVTTIQQVNMIQDLSNLIVRDGDFRGGTFDGGSVTNASTVSATTGSFGTLSGGSLTAGATTLATTTITGDLTVSGTITPSIVSASTSISAPYFTATSGAATSTFAGLFSVGTSSPWGSGLLTVGTSSPLLYVDNASGNVGIGTTTPTWLLNPSSATAPQLALSAGAGFSQWAMRNAGGILYIATTTVAGTATSTTAALTIDANGNISIASTLGITGLGTFGSGFLSQASSTVVGLLNATRATTTQFTNTGSTWLTGLADRILSVDGNGLVIGTSTPTAAYYIATSTSAASTFPYASTTALTVSGTAYFPGSGIWNSSGNVGIGKLSPAYKLDAPGIASYDDYSRASYFVPTSTATSTIAGGISASLVSSPYFHATSTTATSTFAGGLTALSLALTNQLTVSQGGTGATTFGQGWIYSTGGTAALAASTSPTVNYVVATSTTVASVFPYASTTAITASGTGYFGLGQFTQTSGTTTIASGQGFTIGTSQFVLQQGSGNVGIGTTSPGTLLSIGDTGNDTINLSPTATSTFGSGLNLRTGCFALSGSCLSLGNIAGTLAVNQGGTGATTFGQGWIYSTGGTTALAASTSPTVNYVVATSTTLASIFPYASTTALTVSGNAYFPGSGIWNSSGNVGIGTANPANRLAILGTSNWGVAEIIGNGTNAEATLGFRSSNISQADAGDWLIGVNSGAVSTGSFAIQDAGTARLTINSSGNVGIGTTTPSGNLVINGTTGNNLLQIATSTNQNIFSVNQNGFVSVGANSGSGSHLTVTPLTVSASNTSDLLTLNNITGDLTYAGIRFQTFGTNRARIEGWGPGSNLGSLRFWTADSASTESEKMRIDATGNIGIGTTSPGTLLSLGDTGADTINLSATATSTFGSGLNIRTGCYAIGSSCLSLATISGILPIASGGTNASVLGSHMLLAFDGT
ncbi:MAG: hypothetical protein Q8P36_01770, partial [bacterium]|nr:hypothetical protein [bacterium]